MKLAHPSFISRGRDVRLDEIMYFVHTRVHPAHLLHQLRDRTQNRICRWCGRSWSLIIRLLWRNIRRLSCICVGLLLRVLLLTGAIWRVHLIGVPPKSLLLLLHRIMINRVIKISRICTLIVRLSLLTLPSWRALSIHALPLNCHDRTIHLDVIEA